MIRPLLWVAGAGLVLGITGFFLLTGPVNMTGKSTPEEAYFRIEKGMTLRQVARDLYRQGYIRHAQAFVIAARLTGRTEDIRAGFYTIPDNLTVLDLLNRFAEGEVITRQVTIPEGLTARRMAGLLKKRLGIDSLEFMQLFSDRDLLKRYGIPAPTFEGYLLPETHEYQLGVSASEVFTSLVEAALKVWEDSTLTEALTRMKITRHQALTMASIVEGEARLPHERTIISGLYWNRIKRNMQLQADPTIQYLIKNGPRRVLYKDLEVDSPYNTYKYRGLPPGPVNNPGRDAIVAALNPDRHDFIFMVADGHGGHVFTRTLSEHAVAKDRYDKIMAPRRKELRKKQ
ncbi:MAG: endolytic transglycosylase MltG [Bacteroidetes bacterium]|nr:endolytic transglycosylase MltG [Bacteroidota bacterium]